MESCSDFKFLIVSGVESFPFPFELLANISSANDLDWYSFQLYSPELVVVETYPVVGAGTEIGDTRLYLANDVTCMGSEDCAPPFACQEQIGLCNTVNGDQGDGYNYSRISLNLPPGHYFVIVKGEQSHNTGYYGLVAN